jgi:alcohol dehydrogenase
MAGVAFSNSMVGLVHALGHSLGAVCHIPHGLCMSLFLPYVLEYNQEINGERIGELLLYLAGEMFMPLHQKHNVPPKPFNIFVRCVMSYMQRCKLPRTLTETGKVREDQLRQVAELTVNDGAIIFNPKEANVEDALAVLKRAWI